MPQMCCEAWEWRMSDFSHLRSAMISRNALPKVSYCYYCMEIILEKVTPMGIIRYEWLRPEPGLQDATMGKPQFPLHLRDASAQLHPSEQPSSSWAREHQRSEGLCSTSTQAGDGGAQWVGVQFKLEANTSNFIISFVGAFITILFLLQGKMDSTQQSWNKMMSYLHRLRI